MLDDFQHCDICDWLYHIHDIFCSGCKKDISNLEILFPKDKKIFTYKSTKSIDFKIKNKSSREISFFNPQSHINAYSENTISFPFSEENIGRKVFFNIENSFDYPMKYIIEVLPDPEITSIIVEKKIEREGRFFIDNKLKNITFRVNFSQNVFIEEIFNTNKENENITILSDKSIYSKNFDFIYDIQKINSEIFEIEICFKINNFKEIKKNILIEKENPNGDEIIFKQAEPTYLNENSIKLNTNKKNIKFIFDKRKKDLEIEDIIFEHKDFISKSNIEDKENQFIINCEIYPNKMNNITGLINSKIKVIYRNRISKTKFEKEISFDFEVENEKRLKYPLVIDFGTSNTSIAWIQKEDSEEKIKILEFPKDSITVESEPTFIYFTNDETVETSSFHFNRALKSVESFGASVFGWKKFFGTDYKKIIYSSKKENIKLTTKRYNITELTSIYLKKIISYFEEKTQLKPDEFAFTYPATYDSKKHILKDAMKSLGYDENKIKLELNESNAITYFVAKTESELKDLKQDEKKIFVIFDFGGGTLDVTFASIDKKEDIISDDDGFEIINDVKEINILDSSGPKNMGGDYLDFEITKILNKDSQFNFNSIDELFNYERKDEDDSIKITDYLENFENSRKLKYDAYKYGKRSNNEELNDEELNNIKNNAKEFVNKAFEYLKKSFNNLIKNKILKENTKIDYIFLCGNSSKLNIGDKDLEEIAKEELNSIIIEEKNIKKLKDLKLSVVKGACYYYSTSSSDYKLNGLNSLPITLGYEYGGLFYTFKAPDNKKSIRGLNFSDLIELRASFKKMFNSNSNIEKIYYSFSNSLEDIEGKTILNNPDFKVALEINIPEELKNRELILCIYLSKKFPEIDISFYDTKIKDKSNKIKYKLEF